MFDMIAFDADDTLWHNERLYAGAQARLRALLAPYAAADLVDKTLYQTELRNLADYGYGIKAFTLSMMETAASLSQGRLPAAELMTIVAAAREMIAADVILLPGVAETVADLARTYRLMVITKGDLLDQERKLARSGLAQYFESFEVVSHKTPAVYRALLVRHGIDPARFLMVGNSLRSDILPVVAVGGAAVYIPHDLTWAHEATVEPHDADGYVELTDIVALPGWLASRPA